MKKFFVLVLATGLFACTPSEDTRPDIAPLDSVQVEEPAPRDTVDKLPMVTLPNGRIAPASEVEEALEDTDVSSSVVEERNRALDERLPATEASASASGVSIRGRFALPGQGVPVCVSVLDDSGDVVPGVEVEIVDSHGNNVNRTDNPQAPTASPSSGVSDSLGFFYSMVSGENEGWYFFTASVDGRQLINVEQNTGSHFQSFNVTEDADELNVRYPLALTPYPEGHCAGPNRR